MPEPLGRSLPRSRRRATQVVLLFFSLIPGQALAQTTTTATPPTVQEVLAFLVTNQGVQTSDFDKDREAAEATRDTLTRALLSSVATLPITASSGGFTYRLSPTLGTVVRASETFGPFYVERAVTTPAGHASFGVTFQYSAYTSIDGNDLRSGEFVTVANQFKDEPTPFDVETLTLRMSTRSATAFGNIGLGNRVDVGVAVPLVRIAIDGERVNTYRGTTRILARASADTVGLADIAVRSKVLLTNPVSPTAVTAGVEVRLPTGREEDLLGTGETAIRFLGIASHEAGRAGIHGNIVYGVLGLGRGDRLRRRRLGGNHVAAHAGRGSGATPPRGAAGDHAGRRASPAHQGRPHHASRSER